MAETACRCVPGDPYCSHCPGCGEDWDSLPMGHSVAYPMDGSPITCQNLRPVSPEEFMRGIPAEDGEP